MNPEVISALLKANANPNNRNMYGRTALHGCAGLDAPECISLLTAAGAMINILDHKGYSSVDVEFTHQA